MLTFYSAHHVHERVSICASLLYLGSLYARLGECIGNVVRATREVRCGHTSRLLHPQDVSMGVFFAMALKSMECP